VVHAETTTLGLDELVQAHSTTRDAIYSALVTVGHQPVGGRDHIAGSTDCWAKRGQKERFTRRVHRRSAEENRKSVSLTDITLDYATKRCRYLTIGDESQISRLSLNNRQTLLTYEAPFDRNFLELQIYGYFLLRLAYNTRDDFRPLEQLIHECPDASVVGIGNVDGTECYEVNLTVPGQEDWKGGRMQIFLDPSAGFLARQAIIHHIEEAKAGPSAGNSSRHIIKILEFSPFTNGAYFPKVAESYLIDDGDVKSGHNRFEVLEISINESVDEGKLHFDFPSHSIVRQFADPVTPLAVPRIDSLDLVLADGTLKSFPADGVELQAFLASSQLGSNDDPTTSPVASQQSELLSTFTQSPNLLVVGLGIAATVISLGLGARYWQYWRRRAPDNL
jgi:hypothetical protein